MNTCVYMEWIYLLDFLFPKILGPRNPGRHVTPGLCPSLVRLSPDTATVRDTPDSG